MSEDQYILSGCSSESVKYLHSGEIRIFEEAKSFCVEKQSILASIPNQNIFTFIIDFLITNNVTEDIWFGLVRLNADDPLNPSTFEFLDGSKFS